MTEKINLSRMLENALAAHGSGDLFNANKEFRHVSVFFPGDSTAWTMLGMYTSSEENSSIRAGHMFQRAAVCEPSSTAAIFNWAAWARDAQHDLLASSLLQRVLCLDPSEVRSFFLSGIIEQERGAYVAAERRYERVLRLAPDHPEAHTNLGFIELAHGVFESGWRNYEWRMRTALHAERHPIDPRYPLWTGGPIAGKTILLTSEQGLGDTIQFVRYASKLASDGARVVVRVDPSLSNLVSTLEGISAIDRNGQLSGVDYQASLMSLPGIFSTNRTSIPYSTESYLHADRILSDRWRTRLGSKTGFRIGVVWSGSTPRRVVERSIPLSHFVRIFEGKTDIVELICLQKEIWPRDVETLHKTSEIRFFGDEIENFSDTAALIDQCELVITIDTSVAHLSGALGAETWLLLPYVADWRWMIDDDDSPWYPSVKIFRQRKTGDWPELIDRVQHRLNRRLSRS